MSQRDEDWTTKHIITTFIVGLFLVLLISGIFGGVLYNYERDRVQDRERRAVVEQCIRENTRSAVDCRVAVYGRVGRR